MYMYMYLSKTSQPAALHHLETAFDFYKDSRVKKSYETWWHNESVIKNVCQKFMAQASTQIAQGGLRSHWQLFWPIGTHNTHTYNTTGIPLPR